MSFSMRPTPIQEQVQNGHVPTKPAVQPTPVAKSCRADAKIQLHGGIQNDGDVYLSHESIVCIGANSSIDVKGDFLCENLDGSGYHSCDISAILYCC